MSRLDLERIFKYHPPHGTQASRYEAIRDMGRTFAMLIETATPESAEQTLAIRKVQEAVMWANASIAITEAPDAVDSAEARG